MDWFRSAGAAAVIVAAAALLRTFVVEPYRLNIVSRDVAIATNAALQTASEAEAPVIARENLEKLRRFSDRRWPDAEVFVLIAANRRVLRDYDRAVEAYDRAIALQPAPYLYLNRGVTELAAGRPDAAHRSFARAAQFDPALAVEGADAERAWRALHPQR